MDVKKNFDYLSFLRHIIVKQPQLIDIRTFLSLVRSSQVPSRNEICSIFTTTSNVVLGFQKLEF
jgi:hypothetical protein